VRVNFVGMNFKNIGIVGKTGEQAQSTLNILIEYLGKRGLNVRIEKITSDNLGNNRIPVLPINELCADSDLIIVVGGDGTMLGTARQAVLYDTPVLGINLGRLGFLVDISPDDMHKSLDQVFEGNFETDRRSLLEVSFDGDSQKHVAFNDIVLHKWNTARLIEFETFINKQFVDRQRSDGLIISTPTGSTAYALSGGGPLIHPALDAIALVPICPHTLSNRPIVVDAGSKIEIRVCENTSQDHLRITCDGQHSLAVENQQNSIFIQKHDKQVSLIHPPGHDHFHILRTKLGWGKHTAN
jgi:NAD+ kinase